MLRARLLSALVAIPLLLGLILWPSPWPMGVFVFAIGVVGLAEFADMVFRQQTGERLLTILLGSLLLACGLVAVLPQAPPMLTTAGMSLAVAVGLAWVLFTRPDFEAGLRDLGLVLLGALYVGWLLPHFLHIQQHGIEGPWWVIFIVAIAMSGDAAGYFVGKSLGRHKLAPRVSPGKSVEGALGILLASVAMGALFRLVVFVGLAPWLGLGEAPSWAMILGLATLLGVVGQVGDLSESVMKRAWGIKESGWIIPGHGGVLDRTDSLLFPAVLVYYFLLWLR